LSVVLKRIEIKLVRETPEHLGADEKEEHRLHVLGILTLEREPEQVDIKSDCETAENVGGDDHRISVMDDRCGVCVV